MDLHISGHASTGPRVIDQGNVTDCPDGHPGTTIGGMGEANYVPLSPLTFLARAARAYPERTAVVEADGTRVSYREVAADCAALAGALRGHGIAPGDRVAILDLNSRHLLAAHYGVPGAGEARVALYSRVSAGGHR